MAEVVLVHGNPETSAIWGPLEEALGRSDVHKLSPPGFGAALPAGFEATSDGYRDWLAGQLTRFDEPVDLVGHDWGGGHVARIAMERPELIRSWVTDIAGCFAPDYVWHDMAQAWQTPGMGEEAVAGMVTAPTSDRIALFESLGMSPEIAREVAAGVDEAMGRCILTLYRSATQPAMAELGQQLASAAGRPGLVLIPTEDSYTGGEERARWAAERAGARVAVLDGLGHWWMIQDPQPGAAALQEFWASLD